MYIEMCMIKKLKECCTESDDRPLARICIISCLKTIKKSDF